MVWAGEETCPRSPSTVPISRYIPCHHLKAPWHPRKGLLPHFIDETISQAHTAMTGLEQNQVSSVAQRKVHTGDLPTSGRTASQYRVALPSCLLPRLSLSLSLFSHSAGIPGYLLRSIPILLPSFPTRIPSRTLGGPSSPPSFLPFSFPQIRRCL